jgi:hypothetical protein
MYYGHYKQSYLRLKKHPPDPPAPLKLHGTSSSKGEILKKFNFSYFDPSLKFRIFNNS